MGGEMGTLYVTRGAYAASVREMYEMYTTIQMAIQQFVTIRARETLEDAPKLHPLPTHTLSCA